MNLISAKEQKLTDGFLGQSVDLGGDFELVSWRVGVDFGDQQSPSLLQTPQQLAWKWARQI